MCAVEYILRIQARIPFPCLRIEAEGKLYYGVFCQDDFVLLSGGHWIMTRLEGEKGLWKLEKDGYPDMADEAENVQ